jgi:hypothetical protein
VYFGEEAGAGVSAVHIESEEVLPEGGGGLSIDEPRAYLHDADPAAIRAHTLGTLCGLFDLRMLGDSNGYLTGDGEVCSPWLRSYRVLYHGKADVKVTRKALRDLGAATPELKQRAAGLDLQKERGIYRSDGSRSVSLAIWPLGRSLRHTILERI